MQLKYGRHQISQSVYSWPYHLTKISPGTEGPREHRRESLQAELILNATRPHRRQGRISCVLNCEWESWEWAISVCDCHCSRHYTITNTHTNRCTYTSNDENREEHKGKQNVTYWLHSKAQYEWMQSGANLSQHWHRQNHHLFHYTITRLWLTAGYFYLPIQYAKNYVTLSFDSNLIPHKAMVYCTERCFCGNCFLVMS